MRRTSPQRTAFWREGRRADERSGQAARRAINIAKLGYSLFSDVHCAPPLYFVGISEYGRTFVRHNVRGYNASQHGIKRVVYTPEALEAKKKREQARLQEYLALSEAVMSKVS